MNLLMKWTFVFAAVMMAINSSHAWNIGTKGRVNGPVIHTTYFLTQDNAPFNVHAQAFIGSYVNGICVINGAPYDLGIESLRTGDFIDIDAYLLKSVIGLNNTNNCMSIYYTYQQLVIETFVLNTDGINYINTIPQTAEVTIL